MKSNREFLDGIYSKARALEKETIKPVKNLRIYYRFASIAAVIILIPAIFFWNNNMGYEEITAPMVARTMNDPSSYFYEADFIVIGKAEEIGTSQYVKDHNYIYTPVTLSVKETVLGEIHESEIIIRVNGGKVKKEKVWSKMDSDFIEGKNSLVFLTKDGNGIYQLVNSESQFEEVGIDLFKDKSGQEYSLEDIKNIIKVEE